MILRTGWNSEMQKTQLVLSTIDLALAEKLREDRCARLSI
jgi:hypothetical protein